MADPYLQDGVWRLRFKDRRGKWRQPRSSAQTKTEAKRLNREAERLEERYRLGIEAPPAQNSDATFGAMLTWWIQNCLVKSPAYKRCVGTVTNHLLQSVLAQLPAAEILSLIHI